MSYYRRTRRGSTSPSRSMVAFLMVASFGILFVGCGGQEVPEEPVDEFTFTEDDVQRFRELVHDAQEDSTGGITGTSGIVPNLEGSSAEPAAVDAPPVLDLSNVSAYNSIRSGPGAAGDNVYRVTNSFLNVRSDPWVTAAAIERLVNGDAVEVIDFTDAAWAHVRLADGQEGYVALRYISKLVAEEKIDEEKAAFDGLWFVGFGFLNVRRSPETTAEKLGELPGQSIVRPISMDDVWARVMFDGVEGYVAREYLSPFQPSFLVRQNLFTLPILHYRIDEPGVGTAMQQHLAALKNAGYKLLTLRDYEALLRRQEERDVRLEPKSAAIVVSNVTAENASSISAALLQAGVDATLCIASSEIGIDGITEKQLLTLQANGFDIQSGGHTGDDLRSLTNAQVELELKQSRKILEEMTGRDVFTVAYPLGGVNDRVAKLAAESGYLFGLGAAPEKTHSREQFLRLPSFVIGPDTTTEEVLSHVTPE